jgi:hypothetical protein
MLIYIYIYILACLEKGVEGVLVVAQKERVVAHGAHGQSCYIYIYIYARTVIVLVLVVLVVVVVNFYHHHHHNHQILILFRNMWKMIACQAFIRGRWRACVRVRASIHDILMVTVLIRLIFR